MDIYTEILTCAPHLATAIYEGHEGRCFYTGRFVNTSESRVDHIYPKAKGGKNCIANYVLTSHTVNMAKFDHVDGTLVERMQYINVVAFAPKVLRRYIELLESDAGRASLTTDSEGWVTLLDYAKLRGVRMSDHEAAKNVAYEVKPKPGQKRLHRQFRVEDLDKYLQSKQ